MICSILTNKRAAAVSPEKKNVRGFENNLLIYDDSRKWRPHDLY